MKHYTLDTNNHVTVHGSRKKARAAGVDVFATEEQFEALIASDHQRLVAI